MHGNVQNALCACNLSLKAFYCQISTPETKLRSYYALTHSFSTKKFLLLSLFPSPYTFTTTANGIVFSGYNSSSSGANVFVFMTIIYSILSEGN